MDDCIECPVCSDIYGTSEKHIRAPKVLICGHSICKECLEKLIKSINDDYFICPVPDCKIKIKKEEKIDDYIDNKSLIRVINSYFNISQKEVFKNPDNKPYIFNIISLGQFHVGKTSIFLKLAKDIFSENYTPTKGCDLYKYYMRYNDKKCIVHLIDTQGQEEYKSITKTYLRNKDGVFFIYDITNKESFDDLECWINMYKEVNENVIGLIIGNKCDCEERVVNEDEAKLFAQKHNLNYMETSAKLDKNIKKAIAYLIDEIIKFKLNQSKIYTPFDSFSVQVRKEKNKSCC